MGPIVWVVGDSRAAGVLRWVNARHGLDLELVGLFVGGRQGGAWRARSPSGEEVVFKWTTDPGLARRRSASAEAIARLRGRNYPTPAWLASGVTDAGFAYVVQARVAGSPGTWRTVPLDELMAIVELQAGLGRPSAESWSSYVEWAAFHASGPRHDVGSTAPGRALVGHFDEVLEGHGRGVLPTDDLVPGDLNTSNVLVADGHVVALIDIDAIGTGTRAVDYAWLLREAFTVNATDADKELIRTAGTRVAGSAVFATCVAATALDIVVFEAASTSQPSQPRSLDELHALADFVR